MWKSVHVQVFPAEGLHQGKKKGVCYDTKRILEGWDIEHMEEMEKFQQDVLT